MSDWPIDMKHKPEQKVSEPDFIPGRFIDSEISSLRSAVYFEVPHGIPLTEVSG